MAASTSAFVTASPWPDPEDLLGGWEWQGPNNPVVAPGEFILGLPREGEDAEPGFAGFCGPAWAKHGSFLVFRKLKQDVRRFNQDVDDAWEAVKKVLTPVDTSDEGSAYPRPVISRDQVRARLMGRWPSGVKLTFDESASADSDPGNQNPNPGDIPSWMVNIWGEEFVRDIDGAQCPLFAHIRKAHPRSRPDARTHRIIRRGITYGPSFDERLGPDDRDRGLYFLAYQADIERQFKRIEVDWLTSFAVAEVVKVDDPRSRIFRGLIRSPVPARPGCSRTSTTTRRQMPMSN